MKLSAVYTGLACAALATAGSACAEPDVDVVVVGAGMSGLQAARDLQVAGKSVKVFEARDRVGGRVENFALNNGGVTELGAAFVGPTQDRVLALAKRLGIETFREYNSGFNVLYINGKARRYAAALTEVLPVSPVALLQLQQAQSMIDKDAKKINVHAPWNNPMAKKWDSMTLEDVLKPKVTDKNAYSVLDTAVAAVLSATPSELSYLYFLSYVAAAGNQTKRGNFNRLVSTGNGAQQSRLVGGTGLLPQGLAKEVGDSNIIFQAPVRDIMGQCCKAGGACPSYNVTADGGHTTTARDVVVAMSPPLARSIKYDPPLPKARDELTKRMFMGSLGKAIAIYDTPFWRKDLLSGQAISLTGGTRATFDVSNPNGSYGAMLGFIEADQMRKLDHVTEKKLGQVILKDFVNYLGPKAKNVKQWVFKRWDNEEYSRGGPVALAGPGTLSAYGPALRAPFHGIHFAGTESAPYWTGYMDGALRSGERVAKEIIGS